MYAIVKTGGKQYRVERGQRLLVERLPVEEGADVALEPILYRSEEAVFDRDGLANVKVTAKVLGHVRGEKLRVFKFKPKRGYKRRTGHRQELTRIEVTEIATGRRKAAKAAPEGERAAGEGTKRRSGAKAAGEGTKRRSGAKAAGEGADRRSRSTAKPRSGDSTEAKAGEGPKPARARKASASKAKKEPTDDGS
jgi:large subunit ribosomal protein L21